VEATVGAPTDKVWEFWNEPEHIVNWTFAADDWCCPSASNDLRIGGTYSARMEAKDGSFGFDFEAVYDEVIPRKRIAYTMADGRQATTTFQPMENGTKITTVFDAENQNPVEMQREGWQAILENFKRYVEQ
jgi:uncharacterized protein YndB with AHSA1/START domain